jgi:hypothetical protein
MTWMPRPTVSTRITWRFHDGLLVPAYQETAPPSARTARRYSARRASGTAYKRLFALRNSASPATPPGWTTVTIATERAGSFTRFRSPALHRKPSRWPYNVKHIADKAHYHTEFASVTDVALSRDNDRHRFVIDTLREVGVEPVPTEGLALWVAKLRPSLLQ